MSKTPVALITGASGGIGLSLARLFAKDSHDLILVARSGDALRKLAAELEAQHPVRVHVLPADLADPAAPQRLFDEVIQADLAVDVLVNNAGFATYGPFADAPEKDERDMIQVNVMALTHLTRLFLPGMVARKRGRILNVASTAAFQPGPFMAVYYATKAFVLSFSEAIDNELKGTGVTVTALCPGPTQTGFQSRAKMEKSKLFAGKGRVMDVETVAKAGYEALMRGKPLVIPGFTNKLLAWSIRFTPRAWVPGIVRKVQEERKG